MAVSWEAVSASEITDRGADYPFLGVQGIPVSPAYAKWVEAAQVGANDITTWTDRTLAANPIRRAYDGKTHLVTKTDATGSNEWYLCFDLGAAVEVDYCGINGHNFDTLALTTIELEHDDANTFRSANVTIGSFTLRGSDKRLIDIDLRHAGSDPLRYTGRYFRLKLAKVANFVPEVSEIFIGRSYQLHGDPKAPFDPTSLNEQVDFGPPALSGVLSPEINHQRRFELSASMTAHESDHISDLIAWYRATRSPFVWLYEPTSAVNAWHMMLRRSAMIFPAQGFVERTFDLEATEQGPESYYLDVEDN